MGGEIPLNKLNVGAGGDIREDYVNADIRPGAGIDVVFDANDPWPFAADSFGMVTAKGVIEHLSAGLIPFMDQAWRVLENDGYLWASVPSPTFTHLWDDPTHIRPYTPNSFRYFTPGHWMYNDYGRLYTDRPWRADKLEINREANTIAIMRPIKARAL